MVVKEQAGVMGAAEKCLKTSICVDLTLSLATGFPFLNKWPIRETATSCIFSAEPASERGTCGECWESCAGIDVLKRPKEFTHRICNRLDEQPAAIQDHNPSNEFVFDSSHGLPQQQRKNNIPRRRIRPAGGTP